MAEYMIRTGQPDRKAHGEFQWSPLGEWTEAPDWDPSPVCGGGLHGQAPEASGFQRDAQPDVWLCETDGPRVVIDGDKIKVPRARIVAINDLSKFRLPPFEGSLSLEGCTGLVSLPEGLQCGGYLDLMDCIELRSLPEGLTVGGHLDLEGCTGLRALPEGLKVGGSLDLRRCKGLRSLPKGLQVGGSIILGDSTELVSLPEEFTIGGGLYLRYCTGLVSLPEGLQVGGDLDLEYCTGLRALPEGLRVKGYLYLKGSGVMAVPASAAIGGEICGLPPHKGSKGVMGRYT